MKKCPKCDKPHNKQGKFCSRVCANSRIWSKEDKIKKSVSAKNSEKVLRANKNKSEQIKKLWEQGFYSKTKTLQEWICPVCSNKLQLREFEVRKRKYCSGTCRNKINNQIVRGTRSKAEKELEITLIREFPNLKVIYNSRKILSNNKELDVYIPTLSLAIEWNGPWHYMDCRTKEFLNETKERDLQKEKECETLGIKLYVVKDLTSHKKFIHSEIEKIIKLIQDRLR